VSAVRVSDGFFRTLGVKPALGRDFYEGEDKVGAPPTALLSAAAWRDRFSGRPDVIGQTVMLSGKAFTIIGVLPNEFQFSLRGRVEFWTALQPSMECEKRRSCHNLYGVARLKDGVTVASGRREPERHREAARKRNIRIPTVANLPPSSLLVTRWWEMSGRSL
jgi:hypothetical protein